MHLPLPGSIRFLLLAPLLSLPACKPEEPVKAVQSAEDSRPKVVFPDHFKSAWVMSSGWLGYMGVAIAVSEDRYYYWMYSDAGSPTDCPYSGSYSIDGGVLRLGEATSMVTGRPAENPLYCNAWTLVSNPLAISLHAVQDKVDDRARTLVLDVQFDPQEPFHNQEKLKPKPPAPGK